MKKEKWIDIIFWCWILFGMIITINSCLEVYNLNIEMLINMLKEDFNLIWYGFGIIFCIFIFQLVFNGFITIGYIVYKLVMRKHRKERLEKIDLKNDEYYREIIPKYSVAVLSYIDDFEINENDIAATILALKLKKCIGFNENKIEILNENVELSKNEKYILNCLKTNSTVMMPEFKKSVETDASDSKLVEKKIKVVKMFFKSILSSIISSVLGIFLIRLLGENDEINEYITDPFKMAMFITYLVGIIACFTVLPFVIWSKFFIYIGVKIKDPYLRSKEGKELNKKLEGLRKYILDFSLMEEKEKDSLTVWEEYLVYSVVFGINKKVSEDILKMIKI